MKKTTLLIFLAFVSHFAASKDIILQGPFNIDEKNQIIFTSNKNNLISFIQINNGKKILIDSYKKGDDNFDADPNLESVFFMKINGEKNIIVLLSEILKKPYGNVNIDYSAYAYIYKEQKIDINKMMSNDVYMSNFPSCVYDAASVKAYINKKYNNIEPTHMAKNWWHDCGFDDN